MQESGDHPTDVSEEQYGGDRCDDVAGMKVPSEVLSYLQPRRYQILPRRRIGMQCQGKRRQYFVNNSSLTISY